MISDVGRKGEQRKIPVALILLARRRVCNPHKSNSSVGSIYPASGTEYLRQFVRFKVHRVVIVYIMEIQRGLIDDGLGGVIPISLDGRNYRVSYMFAAITGLSPRLLRLESRPAAPASPAV